MASPNPSFEPETHRWRPGAVAPSREVPSQIRAVLGQKQPFFAQNSPQIRVKRPNEGNRWLHPMCGLTSPCQRALSQKGAKKPQHLHNVHQHPETKHGPYLGLRGSNPIFRGHLVHPQPPTFCGFQALESRNDPPRPTYQWSLGGAGGQPGPRTVGANGGSTGVPEAKKMIFFKVVPGPLGMLKQVFLGRFEHVVARFGPWKLPKCLGNGLFQDQKWVKNGSKMRFSKSDPGPFGMLKQVFLAHFESVGTRFGPWKIPICLEKWAVLGPKKAEKCVKNVFFQKLPWTIGGAQTSVLSPF